MKIKIKTASSYADIAALCMLRSETGQLIALVYSASSFIAMEYVGFNVLSPMFPVENSFELDKVFKIGPGEKAVAMNVNVERLSEEEMTKVLDQAEYSIYYKRNKKYYDLVKFEPQDDEEQSFFITPHNNMMT